MKKILKEWMLPIAMLAGMLSYLVYYGIPALHPAGPVLSRIIGVVQPLLIFLMLFLSFSKIRPRDIRLHRWHLWLLLIQGGLFCLGGAAILFSVPQVVTAGDARTRILIECAMICFICPTATASAVVTGKLKGDMAGITTYIILINLLTSVLVPLVIPMINPSDTRTFTEAFSLIVAKIFPLLIFPCLAAWLVRYLLPRVHRRIQKYPDLAFHLWAVALTLAICVTTRALVHSDLSFTDILLMALISLTCCAFQFWMGRKIGRWKAHKNQEHATEITAGQALGQKNTVFAIWMGLTFMTPVTAVVGGFYSIWHNLWNSWELRKAARAEEKEKTEVAS